MLVERRKKNLTQAELGELCGLSETDISSIESGEIILELQSDSRELYKIAEVLGVDDPEKLQTKWT